MLETLLKVGKWAHNKIINPYKLNNAQYWDRYALRWKLSGAGKQFHRLGEEWKNEEIFVKLLQRQSQ
jgi:hypothetical protein